jgi:hypothetical protein
MELTSEPTAIAVYIVRFPRGLGDGTTLAANEAG